MNEIEELYEQILSEDFDYSTLDKLIALVEENAKEKIINRVCEWLEKELFDDVAEPNPYYATDVKSKSYDTKEDFIFEFRKAMEL